MSWIVENPLTWMQTLGINVIKSGPVPRHVAFIMDGNRRYAAKENVEKAVGHSRGFTKLSETLEWCRKLGIIEVTVYAFSIENFKRPKDEVDILMNLAREKFEKLLSETDKLMENGVKIRIFGNMDLLEPDIRAFISKTVLLTKDNNKYFLNVAFAYTSSDEIANSVKTIVKGVKDKQISSHDIDVKLISQCMYSNDTPDPDIIVRTSGEIRLSDFLLWQLGSTKIEFAEIYWPDFNIWHLLIAVFKYQRCYHTLKSIKSKQNRIIEESCSTNDMVGRNQFIDNVNRHRLSKFEEYASYLAS